MITIRKYQVLLVSLLAVTTCSSSMRTHIVNTGHGDILGSVEEVNIHENDGTNATAEFVRYLGIPYAEPPTGELRFHKPVLKGPLTSVHNGTIAGSRCFHGDSRPMTGPVSLSMAMVSEDCLTLDIYAPVGSVNSTAEFSVMVFMPPDSGSSHDYPGDVLSAFGDVIYVVVNFRTGILGYFSLSNEVIPGNFGLWDQQLALHWVNTNIASFNGDPSRVTLISFGIGASRIIFQAMYPGNSGLFHRMIAHSGSPISVYNVSAFLQRPDSHVITEVFGCTQPTPEETASCMRGLSLAEIQTGLSAMNSSVPLTPVIDNEFIIEQPQTILTENDSKFKNVTDMFSSIQLLSGITNMESGSRVAQIWAQLLGQQLNEFQVNRTIFEDLIVPTAMKHTFGPNVTESITKTVAFQYTDGQDPNNDTKIRNSVVQLYTDLDSSVPVVKLMQFHSRFSTEGTYLYQFSAMLQIDNPLTPSWLKGANNGDDIYYLLGFSNLKLWQHTMSYVPTQLEIKTSNMLMAMWTNFAKTGDPNIRNSTQWVPFDSEQSAYMDIGLGFVTSGKYFREPFMQFWTGIVPGLLYDLKSERGISGTETSHTCTINTVNFHSKFGVDGLTSDNIITVLIIASGTLLLAFLLTCSIALTRGTFFKYSVKTV